MASLLSPSCLDGLNLPGSSVFLEVCLSAVLTWEQRGLVNLVRLGSSEAVELFTSSA